jgi:hypothetical protein
MHSSCPLLIGLCSRPVGIHIVPLEFTCLFSPPTDVSAAPDNLKEIWSNRRFTPWENLMCNPRSTLFSSYLISTSVYAIKGSAFGHEVQQAGYLVPVACR